MRYYSNTYSGDHNQQILQKTLIEYYGRHLDELAMFSGLAIDEIKIVDYGCSLPTFLEVAARRGCAQSIGVDWDVSAHEYGKQRGVEMLTPDNISTIEMSSCNILRFSHVLEHLVNPYKVLEKMSEKLVIGGLLHITQPNFPVMHAGSYEFTLKDSVFPEHLHFFNAISLVKMVEAAGFKIHKIFSTDNDNEALRAYSMAIDPAHAYNMLDYLRDCGEGLRGPLNNFPLFSGENSCLMAYKL